MSAASVSVSVDLAQCHALSLIDAHAAHTPERVAVLFEDQRISYGALVSASVQLAQVLSAHGVGRGSHVCLLAHNCPDYYVFYFAVLRCGATLFPVNAELSVDEIAYVLRNSEPTLVVSDDELAPTLAQACALGALPAPQHQLGALMTQARALPMPAPMPAPVDRGPDDMALVIHTSGTTARPKGVVATDRMELLSAAAMQACWDVKPGDISLCALPLSYTFGLFSASYVAFNAGATVLLLRKFSPARALQAIEKYRASFMLGVPTMYAMMLDLARKSGQDFDVSSIRLMAASGAPITMQSKQDFERCFGIKLRDYYALSECAPIFSFDLQAAQTEVPEGSVGTLVPGVELRLLGDDGQDVAPGETGALRVRSECLMPGYFRDAERTALAYDGDWFKTGDLAYRDAEGFYFIVGRDRDQVISGGHKIASTEVEGLIARLQPVAGVAVVGKPDPVLGEIVKAVVVLKEGAQLEAAAVIDFCQQHLAAYKVPRLVEFRSSLPVSPAGKVLKRELV